MLTIGSSLFRDHCELARVSHALASGRLPTLPSVGEQPASHRNDRGPRAVDVLIAALVLILVVLMLIVTGEIEVGG